MVTTRVAIVHDYLTQRGGAERVVLALMRLFPHADLYTSVYDPAGTYPEFRGYEVRTSALQRLPHRRGWARALLPLYPATFERFDLSGYDLVISSSSGFAHGVVAPGAFHVVYCYNPPRFLYQTEAFLSQGAPVPRFAARLIRPLLDRVRRWDQRAARRPDAYIAISETVAERIRCLYGRDAPVVHPPVDVGRVSPLVPARPPDEPPYYLVVSRLLPYKRVDLAVGACKALGRRLVVVGEGPCKRDLQALGGDVEFRSRVDDATLNELLHGCTALLQPGIEDFGLAPLEANAAGRPVVAVGAGGAVETVVDGATGAIAPEQSITSLVEAMRRVESRDWDSAALRQHARSFGEATFGDRLRDVLAGLRTPVERAASHPTNHTDAALAP